MESLEDLRSDVTAFVEEREWQRFHSPKNLAMALTVEAGELQEHFQWLTTDDSEALDAETLAAVADEIADVQVYLVRLADRLGIDLLAACEQKMAKNRAKYPPELTRGRADKYTRYQARPLDWTSLEGVRLDSPFVYRIKVYSPDAGLLEYIGKARNEARLREYQNNLEKIRLGKPRGSNQRYRAVHLALYRALNGGWEYEITAIENADSDNLSAREQHWINALKPVLNGAQTWAIESIRALEPEDLITTATP